MPEKARRRLPEGMVRHEGDVAPKPVRTIKERGRAMDPELSECDRLIVDTARRAAAIGALLVLSDGNGRIAGKAVARA